MRRLAGLALAAAATLAPVTAGAQECPDVTVFRNVSVLTMEADAARADRTVIVESDSIAWIGPADEAVVPACARTVDGEGRFLMPGLADLHAHVDGSDPPLFLANGVTTVREMNGSPGHLALRDSIEAGLVAGPRLIVASPLLAGEEQRWRHELVPDAETATRIADEAKALGYDALKVYDGLGPSAYAALVEASRSTGLPLVGHVPEAVGLDGVLEAGQRSIEHVEQIAYATVGHDPDPGRIPAIVARIAGTGTWVVPTLAVQKALSLRGSAAYRARMEAPEIRFVGPAYREWWASLGGTGEQDPARRARLDAFYAFQRDLVAALHEAGVPLLVGTDTPNPLMVPGFSVHDEIDALLDAGLAPIEVLRAATADAARFLGETGRWGVVAPGARADLLLVDENPFERPATLRAPAGVLVRGAWLDRAALDRMLEEAEPAD